VRLTGLGQGEDGITVEELTRLSLNEIIAAAIKVVASDAVKDMTKGLTEGADAASKAASDAAGRATKSVTDLFKKKKE
jgi:hypothetical protein